MMRSCARNSFRSEPNLSLRRTPCAMRTVVSPASAIAPGISQPAIRSISPKRARNIWSTPLSTACSGDRRPRAGRNNQLNWNVQTAGSGAAGDLALLHVENLAAWADIGERRRVGAGHPDLGAEFCKFLKQRLAPGGIEMRHYLVEQQQRHNAGHL